MIVAAALWMMAGAPARAAVPAYDPWAALSAFATRSSSQALCGTTDGRQVDAVDCAALQDELAPLAQAQPAPSVLPAAAAQAGANVLPLVLGLVAVAAIAALILGSGGGSGNAGGPTPISPA